MPHLRKTFCAFITAFLFNLLLPNPAAAQSWPWAKAETYGLADLENMATDPSGNIYYAGTFTTTIKFGSITLSNLTHNINVYLVKYDHNGNVIWAISGKDGQQADAISVATDALGNVYLNGNFNSSIITFGTDTLHSVGSQSIFLVKFNSSGHAVWGKSYGGPWLDGPEPGTGNTVATDRFGNVYITGQVQSNSLTIGSMTLSNGIGVTFYIARFDANGNPKWLKGSSAGGGIGTSVACDASGGIYVSGFFGTILKLDSVTITAGDSANDMFLAKYDTAGNVKWAISEVTGVRTSFNPNNINYCVAVDKSKNLYVSGSFNVHKTIIGPDTLINTFSDSGTADVFIAKFDSAGRALWAKSAGGKYNDFGYNVATDNQGAVYFTGGYSDNITSTSSGGPAVIDSIVFPPYTLPFPQKGYNPMFVVKYDPSGNVICAAELPQGGDIRNALAIDSQGNTYVGSTFIADSFEVGATPLYTGTNSMSSCTFVAKFQCGPLNTGVNEIEATNNIKVYPNPLASGSWMVEMSEDGQGSVCELYDATGKLVYAAEITSDKFPININAAPGLYLLRVHSKTTSTTLKLIKM